MKKNRVKMQDYVNKEQVQLVRVKREKKKKKVYMAFNQEQQIKKHRIYFYFLRKEKAQSSKLFLIISKTLMM